MATTRGALQRVKIHLNGAVQGVGFRPFVYNLAHRLQLKGYVINDGFGVFIEVEGEPHAIDQFLIRLQTEKPPLAHIFSQEVEYLSTPAGYTDFTIQKSDAETPKEVFILPDVTTCNACLQELMNPADRRYRYPFINCTNCGPRFSIIEALPYDRPNTSMKRFTMCPECQQEYDNPTNRRFHAQPNACPVCGPQITLLTAEGTIQTEREAALQHTIQLLKEGHIVAIKGIGGYHLACRADWDDPVQMLRERKRRNEKPFAVMFPTLEAIQRIAEVTEQEAGLILSPAHPIVLVRKRLPFRLSEWVAPGLNKLGVFLPYSPLHHLLLHDLGIPLVMTSANLSDEPIVKDDEEALQKLPRFVDFLLVHNRPIVNRADDSVVRVMAGTPVPIRRSRGYAPLPIPLQLPLHRPVLAMGAHQKNTIALAQANRVILSQHIGDLETADALANYEQIVERFLQLYEFTPEVIVVDAHPRYHSTRHGEHLGQRWGIPVIALQHHVAHGLALMAERHLPIEQPFLAFSWDGTGYGLDGTIWGGEVLEIQFPQFTRRAFFEPFRLLGGERAVKEPRRVALSVLFHLFGEQVLDMDVPPVRAFSPRETRILFQAWKKGINAPFTSSVGRLFDAIASLIGLQQVLSYEGQSGSRMEDLYQPEITGAYPFEITEGKIQWAPLVQALLKDRSPMEVKISRFINTLAEVVIQITTNWPHAAGVTGGVFQNRPLTERILARAAEEGRTILIHQRVPPNDGGIALGQAIYGGYLASLP